MSLDLKTSPAVTTGLSPETELIARDVARTMAPRVPELAALWVRAIRDASAGGDHLRWLVTELTGLFAAYAGNGDFAGYFEQIASAGRRYASNGVPYEQIQYALSAWLRVGPPLIERSYAKTTQYREAILALESVISRTTATLAEAYVDAASTERLALEAVTDTDVEASSLHSLLRQVLESIGRATRADISSILLVDCVDCEEEPLVVQTSSDDTQINRCALEGSPLIARVLGSGFPESYRDINSLDAATRTALDSLHVRSVLGVPLQTQERTLGVLLLGNQTPRRFSTKEIRFTELLANRLAAAIERFRAHRELQEQARQLAEASAELQALDQLKTAFLATVSHELRTPLTSVMGYVDMIMRDAEELSPRHRRYLEVAARNSRELLNVINSLISFATVEAGYVEVDPVPTALPPIVTRLLTTMLPRFQNKNLQLRWHLPRNLPRVVADPSRLQEALDAILTNALKFTESSGHVFLRAAVIPSGKGRREVIISIDDDGVGIPAEQLQRIWDRFYQVDPSSTRRHGGMGLGLAIAKRLIELQHGRIWVESKGIGKGSTFRIALQVAET